MIILLFISLFLGNLVVKFSGASRAFYDEKRGLMLVEPKEHTVKKGESLEVKFQIDGIFKIKQRTVLNTKQSLKGNGRRNFYADG